MTTLLEGDRLWKGDRLPFEPLLEGDTIRGAARRLGIDIALVSREARGPGLLPFRADSYAVSRLGLHPAEVWGAQWWNLDDGTEGEATDDELVETAESDPWARALFQREGLLPADPRPKRRRRGAPNRWRRR